MSYDKLLKDKYPQFLPSDWAWLERVDERGGLRRVLERGGLLDIRNLDELGEAAAKATCGPPGRPEVCKLPYDPREHHGLTRKLAYRLHQAFTKAKKKNKISAQTVARARGSHVDEDGDEFHDVPDESVGVFAARGGRRQRTRRRKKRRHRRRKRHHTRKKRHKKRRKTRRHHHKRRRKTRHHRRHRR